MDPNTTFICPCCDVTLSTVSKLHCHLERHLGQKPFSCKLCGRKYVLKFEANRHIKEKHAGVDVDAFRAEDPNFNENPAVALTCRVCKETIKSRDELKNHAFTHSGKLADEERELRERKAKKQEKLRKHIEREKRIEERRKRDKDSQIEPDRELRNKRKQRFREEPQLRKMALAQFKCIICAEVQPNIAELSMHINEHMQLLSFTCQACGEQYCSRGEGVRHVVETHEDGAGMWVDAHKEEHWEMRFVCTVCGDTITSCRGMDAHAQLHYSSPEADSPYVR